MIYPSTVRKISNCINYFKSIFCLYFSLSAKDLWTPPRESNGDDGVSYPVHGLPGLEFLRQNGVELKQAYTSSSACGTSRYNYEIILSMNALTFIYI